MFALNIATDRKFSLSAELPLYDPAIRRVGSYTLRLRFDMSFTGSERDYDDYTIRTQKACDDQFISIFTNQKLASVARNLSAEALIYWLRQRLEKKIPRAIKIDEITTECPLLDPPLHSVRGSQVQENNEPSIVKSHYLNVASGNNPDGRSEQEQALISVLYENSLRDKQGQGEPFFSRRDAKHALGLLEQAKAAQKPLNFVIFICPPYAKTIQDGAHKNYDAIHDNFNDDPKTYNFDYNYHAPIHLMAAVRALAKAKGVETNSHIVLGDWGLISIDRILENMGSPQRVLSNLSKFFNGMSAHVAHNYGDIFITSFQQIGACDYLPIGLPYETQYRHEWLQSFANGQDGDRFHVLRQGLKVLLKLAEDQDVLDKLQDWRNYGNIYKSIMSFDGERKLEKSRFVDVAKVYKSVFELRKNEATAMGDFNVSMLKRTAYIDTLLRYTEYQIYSGLFADKNGPSVCMYSDPKFSSCGHFFRHPEVAVAFVDEHKLITAVKRNPDTAMLLSVK